MFDESKITQEPSIDSIVYMRDSLSEKLGPNHAIKIGLACWHFSPGLDSLSFSICVQEVTSLSEIKTLYFAQDMTWRYLIEKFAYIMTVEDFLND